MGLLFWLGVFILSLLVLIKSSDYFTDLSRKFAVILGVPSFIIGITIVAIGTSIPELFTSIIATLNGASDIVPGNVIGSNIANILLILGFCAILNKNLKIHEDLVSVHLPLLVGSAILLFFMLMDSIFTWKEGILLIAGYIIYILFSREELNNSKTERKEKLKILDIFLYIICIIFIYLGAKYTVGSVIELSKMLNIGEELIAATAVAFGTSLPELMVSIQAIRKKDIGLSVGNVLGSNLFNTFVVMSVPSFISPIIIPISITTFILPFMLAITILYFFVSQNKEISKWEGLMMILLYLFFIGMTFGFFS